MPDQDDAHLTSLDSLNFSELPLRIIGLIREEIASNQDNINYIYDVFKLRERSTGALPLGYANMFHLAQNAVDSLVKRHRCGGKCTSPKDHIKQCDCVPLDEFSRTCQENNLQNITSIINEHRTPIIQEYKKRQQLRESERSNPHHFCDNCTKQHNCRKDNHKEVYIIDAFDEGDAMDETLGQVFFQLVNTTASHVRVKMPPLNATEVDQTRWEKGVDDHLMQCQCAIVAVTNKLVVMCRSRSEDDLIAKRLNFLFQYLNTHGNLPVLLVSLEDRTCSVDGVEERDEDNQVLLRSLLTEVNDDLLKDRREDENVKSIGMTNHSSVMPTLKRIIRRQTPKPNQRIAHFLCRR